MGRTIEDVRVTLGGTGAIDEMRKAIEHLLMLCRGAFATEFTMNLGRHGDSEMSIVFPAAKTVTAGRDPAGDAYINVTKGGGTEKHYIARQQPIPLALVIPLWDSTPRILDEAEKYPATREEMETYRRAGLLHRLAECKAIRSGDSADRGCDKCSAVTKHIVVRGSGTPRTGGGATHRLRWRCLKCKELYATDATEFAQF
jgi:hypothetical protein